MYKKLLSVVETRTQIEGILAKKRAKFEEDNAVIIAQLEDLKEKEVLLRDEALAKLDSENLNSVVVDDKVIYKQVRITKSIGDVVKLMTAVESKQAELEENGIKFEFVELFDMEPVVIDKKKVLEVAEAYAKLNGKELDGMTIKETKFIAIKDNANN